MAVQVRAALPPSKPWTGCLTSNKVVNRVLSDEGTITEVGRHALHAIAHAAAFLQAKKVLRDALEDQELRNSAKAAPETKPSSRVGTLQTKGIAVEHRDPLGLEIQPPRSM